MDRRILSQWLRAGFIETHVWHPTDAGTPQGGIISPILMNLTLDGLQQCLQRRFRRTKARNDMVNMVRWADDFIITGRSKELLEYEVGYFCPTPENVKSAYLRFLFLLEHLAPVPWIAVASRQRIEVHG